MSQHNDYEGPHVDLDFCFKLDSYPYLDALLVALYGHSADEVSLDAADICYVGNEVKFSKARAFMESAIEAGILTPTGTLKNYVTFLISKEVPLDADVKKHYEEVLKGETTKASNSTAPINSKNKETLLWIMGVCLHKFGKNGFTAKDKAYPLAQQLINYAEENGIKPKSKNTLRNMIIEGRNAVEICPQETVQEVLDEAAALVAS